MKLRIIVFTLVLALLLCACGTGAAEPAGEGEKEAAQQGGEEVKTPDADTPAEVKPVPDVPQAGGDEAPVQQQEGETEPASDDTAPADNETEASPTDLNPNEKPTQIGTGSGTDLTPYAVSLSAVRSALIEATNPEEPLNIETPALLNLYGIESAWVKQSATFITMSGVFPDEVILVEAVDSDCADKIADKLLAKLAEVMVQAEQYDPETYAIAKKISVVRDGNYLALILSPNYETLLAVYHSYVS